MQNANHAHMAAIVYKQLSDSLLDIIDTCQSTFRTYDSSIHNLKEEITIDEEAITERNTIITTYKVVVIEQGKEITKLKRYRTLATITTPTLIIVITCLIFL